MNGNSLELHVCKRSKRKLNGELRLQPDATSCGPIAIINAYKDINGKFPKISVKRLRRNCKTNDGYGTFRWNLPDNSLIRLNKPVYDIDRIMNMDRFILLYSFHQENQHYVYVTRLAGNYQVYNYCDHSTGYHHKNMNKKQFKELLQNNPRCEYDLDYPLAWTIN